MTKESRSKYILPTPWDEPTEIDIYNWKDGGLYINYWVRTFQEFEKLSPLSGLTFYVIWHHIEIPDLPTYGDNVVAVLTTDEECVIPRYLNKVRYVFKSYGFQPWCGDSLRDPSPASVLKCARNWAVWARHFAFFVCENGFSLTQGGKMVTLHRAQEVGSGVERVVKLSPLGALTRGTFRRAGRQAQPGSPTPVLDRRGRKRLRTAAYLPGS